MQSVLTTRDHQLLEWLCDHGVLTTFQIAHALFPSLDFAQRRLTRLRSIGVVDRFRPFRPDGGSFPYHYVIDQLGAEIIASQRDEPVPRPGHAKVRRRRWTAARTLTHRLGVNQFFTDLAGHARTHPGYELVRWWPESRCAERGAFATLDSPIDVRALAAPIHPDGHGIWRYGERQVPFFLEYDTGSEPLTELTHKLIGYTRLAALGGPDWPVLFWLHATDREHHLHQRLADVGLVIPVATAARDHAGAHGLGPADRVWWLHGDRETRALADLAAPTGAEARTR
ncbi:MAG TPA: replication-relaxation family protein [Micromonosporaceae bacterium]|nr:replication-relaxation family protein [Micromonosporaceae bacterium]